MHTSATQNAKNVFCQLKASILFSLHTQWLEVIPCNDTMSQTSILWLFSPLPVRTCNRPPDWCWREQADISLRQLVTIRWAYDFCVTCSSHASRRVVITCFKIDKGWLSVAFRKLDLESKHGKREMPGCREWDLPIWTPSWTNNPVLDFSLDEAPQPPL